MLYKDVRRNTGLWNVPWNIVDFETTMLPAPEPIEIAVIPIRGGEILRSSAYATLLRPSIPPPWRIPRNVSIPAQMLEDAPPLDEVKAEVRKLLGSGVFVHQARGEAGGLDARIASKFFSVNMDRVDCFSTIRLCKLCEPSASYSLEALCERYKVFNPVPHRAPSDAFATAWVFLQILEGLHRKGVTTFGKFQDFYWNSA